MLTRYTYLDIGKEKELKNKKLLIMITNKPIKDRKLPRGLEDQIFMIQNFMNKMEMI